MSKKAVPTFDRIETVFSILLEFKENNGAQSITKVNYDSIQANSKYRNELIGGRKPDDWSSFKKAIIDNLIQFGISFSLGAGGILLFNNIEIDENLGMDTAKELLNDAKINQIFEIREVLENKLPHLFKYIGSNYSQITLNSFREGFKAYSKGNYSFKFKQGRNPSKFYKSINEYSFQIDGKQDEVKLGELIFDDLKTLLGIDYLVHVQLERAEGKYQNYDFIGYDKVSTITTDELNIYAFELKATNSISSISEAISQATNYKSCANYVSIIIPMFDKKLFFDDDRFQNYLDICKDNGLGVITIELNPDKNKLIDVYEIQKPEKNTIIDYSLQERLMNECNLTYCPLCRKIIEIDENQQRNGCGWRTSKNGKCMKELFENNLDAD